MTQEKDKQLSRDLEQTANRLNHLLGLAANMGLKVEYDIQEMTTFGDKYPTGRFYFHVYREVE